MHNQVIINDINVLKYNGSALENEKIFVIGKGEIGPLNFATLYLSNAFILIPNTNFHVHYAKDDNTKFVINNLGTMETSNDGLWQGNEQQYIVTAGTLEAADSNTAINDTDIYLNYLRIKSAEPTLENIPTEIVSFDRSKLDRQLMSAWIERGFNGVRGNETWLRISNSFSFIITLSNGFEIKTLNVDIKKKEMNPSILNVATNYIKSCYDDIAANGKEFVKTALSLGILFASLAHYTDATTASGAIILTDAMLRLNDTSLVAVANNFVKKLEAYTNAYIEDEYNEANRRAFR